MRRLPSLNALNLFEIVARHGSFTRAADEVCLTQGAVSRQILALEDYYGFPLFRRSPKGLALTAEGELVLPTVRESFARIEEMSMRLLRRRTEIALMVPTCVTQWLLPKLMRFQTEHPDLQLQITTTWRHEVDFRAEPFDAAVVYTAAPDSNVHAIRLFDELLTPVCSPDLLEKHALAETEDLRHCTLLHPTRDHRDWKRWLDHVGAAHIDASSGLSFETLDMATNAAIEGYGVAVSDHTLIADHVTARRLVVPFDAAITTGMAYYLVYPNGVDQQEKIRLLSDWLSRESHDDICTA
ncbi:LysR family transcriptional regulator [Burkholderia sp. Tr-862]|uniref:LysR substrate-binding domain-containing protein n=1 Tax=Burkholderia sp. Tr-862 TaxID=2608331 RepID=UPI001419D610|nr:LysR substrate-binding domain-containing protein [Burkholderia sp. Tr-862]NIF43882.1 LysR family transcriptional regulator [Burkholderia sp. Tr-862]